VANFIITLKKSNLSDSTYVQDLIQDLEGQVSEAISKSEWWLRWGCHYLPSLIGAHLYQRCNNFKDPGIQHYGGELFTQTRDSLDEMFIKLPPPTPTGFAAQVLAQERRQQQIDMREYHNVGGG